MRRIDRSVFLIFIALVAVPVGSARAQQLQRLALTAAESQPALHPSVTSIPRVPSSERGNRRVVGGAVAGASTGVVTGLLLWAAHTFPTAIACDLHNGVSSDAEPRVCNWRAHRRRAQYTWTGLALGTTIGAGIGYLTRELRESSER